MTERHQPLATLPQPCPSCPWRVDTSAADIPSFELDRAERLAGTCPDARGMGPDFGAALFACRLSKVGAEIACAAWLAKVGNCHPGVRFAVYLGRLDAAMLAPKHGWPTLHDTYPEVLTKLRRDVAGAGGHKSDGETAP